MTRIYPENSIESLRIIKENYARISLEKYPEIVAKNPDKYGEIFGKNPDKLPENSWERMEKITRKISEKSQNNSEKIPGNSPESSQKMTEKVLEKPGKLVVKKPENSTNYDVNTLEYCCKMLEKLVVVDGGSIKLNEHGLVLKSNPNYPVFRLNYCPNCGTEIIQDYDNKSEKSLPEPKEILRDNMAKKPPN